MIKRVSRRFFTALIALMTFFVLSACTNLTSSTSTTASAAITTSSVSTTSSESTTTSETPTTTTTSISVTTTEVPVAALYETGFEPIEGFMTDEVMMTYRFRGAVGYQWGFLYGCVSSGGPLSGSQSMLLSWDPAHPDYVGFAFMNFSVVDPGAIVFIAQGGEGLSLQIAYQVGDEFGWHQAAVIMPDETAREFRVELGQEVAGQVKFRFMLVLPDPIPTVTSEIRFDQVRILPKD